MSLKENDLWVAACYQNFGQAIIERDYALAKDIIEDCRDKGFEAEAKEMEVELANTPVDQFAVKSHTLWTGDMGLL